MTARRPARRARVLAVGAAAAVAQASAGLVGCARDEPAAPSAATDGAAVATTFPVPGTSPSVPGSSAPGPGSTAPGASRPRPTLAPTMPPTTPPTVGPPVDLLELTGDGFGVVTFGDSADTSLAALTSILGGPTDDSGWFEDRLQGGMRRTVRWGDLAAVFTRAEVEAPLVEEGPLDEAPPPTSSGQLAGWMHGDQVAGVPAGSGSFATPQGVRRGQTAAEVQAAVGQPLSSRGVEGGVAWCWADTTGQICALFDDATPLDPSGRPDPDDRVTQLFAGEI
jgi:hypothetical protein